MEIVKNEGKVRTLQDKEKEKNELYEMLESLPNPPGEANLSEGAKFWWYWFGNELVKTGKVAKLDLAHLQRAAYWLDVRCSAYKVVNRKNAADPLNLPGHVQRYSTGATNISPWVTLIEKADKALAEISGHFGLSIRDRNKLTKPTAVDPNQGSLFEDFLNRKTS